MREPDPPLKPSCWAWIGEGWHKGRCLTNPEQPIPGTRMGPNWDPGDPALVVHTYDGFWQAVPRSLVVLLPEGARFGEPPPPPEGWVPPEAPDFLR